MMVKQNRTTKRSTKVRHPARRPFPGRLMVIGGQGHKVGKTALVVDLVEAFPKYQWTAIKITPHVESGCPLKGAACRCGPADHTFAIRNEKSRRGRTDTSRFLVAGAGKSIWVQTKSGRLKDALKPLVAAIGDAENVIVESNAILRYWPSDLFFMVVDPRSAEFKSSARKVLRLANAFVFRSPFPLGTHAKGPKIPNSGRPKFLHPLGGALPGSMQNFVRQHFFRFHHPKGK